jgi:aspartyl/asparaginyl-tRNA synthetase
MCTLNFTTTHIHSSTHIPFFRFLPTSRWLSEVAFQKSPLMVTDYPRDIKSFYMRQNTDGRTVAAMDLLVPK